MGKVLAFEPVNPCISLLQGVSSAIESTPKFIFFFVALLWHLISGGLHCKIV